MYVRRQRLHLPGAFRSGLVLCDAILNVVMIDESKSGFAYSLS
jgi:hypothetical protein